MRYAHLLLWLILLTPTAAVAKDRTAKLADGDIFVESIPVANALYPRVHVEGVVDASPAVVWRIINDCARSQVYNSSVTKSYIVERVGRDVVCSETVNLPWPIRDVECVTRWSFQPATYSIHWTLVGGDFDYATGSWKLLPFGDGTRTLVVYENHVSPQISVPNWLKRMFLDVGMPGLIKDLRRAAAS